MRFYISNKLTGDDSTLLVEDQILNSKALLFSSICSLSFLSE